MVFAIHALRIAPPGDGLYTTLDIMSAYGDTAAAYALLYAAAYAYPFRGPLKKGNPGSLGAACRDSRDRAAGYRAGVSSRGIRGGLGALVEPGSFFAEQRLSVCLSVSITPQSITHCVS